MSFFFFPGMKPQRGRVFGRILLGDNGRRGSYVANEQFLVCWNLDFSWTAYIYACAVGHMYTPELPERDCCLSRGVPINWLVDEISHKASFWPTLFSKTENIDLMTRSPFFFFLCVWNFHFLFALCVRVCAISIFGTVAVSVLPHEANTAPWSPFAHTR